MRSTNRKRATWLVVAGLGVLATLASPTWADEKDDELQRLRETMERYAEEQQKLRAQVEDLQREKRHSETSELDAVIADTVRILGDSEPTFQRRNLRRPAGRRIDFGGYFSTRYVSSSEPGKRGSFVDMRLVPQIHAEISENITFDTEVEIEHGGVGGGADGEIVVEYAELTFRFSDAFQLKAGTLLVPFGHFNLNHDDPMNELSSRPRVARYVVPSAFDLPGIGAEGTLELDDNNVLTYDVILTNGFRDNFSSEKGSRDARWLFKEDENHNKGVFARVGIVPQTEIFDALAIGLSGGTGKLGARGEHSLRSWGADVQAVSGPWEFRGEYAAIDIDRDGSAPPPIDRTTGDLGPVRGLSGYYLQLLRRFRMEALKDLPFADANASLALVLRYDHVDLNDRVRGASGQDDERSWSFGINLRPTSRTVIKLEYRRADSPHADREGSDRDFFALEFATYF